MAEKDIPLDGGVQHRKGVQIYIMRKSGIPDETIAKVLNLSVKTLPGYVYRAGRMGWLDDLLDDPRDKLENLILSKVVRNIEESLDSQNVLESGMPERTATALKVAEGALYPSVNARQQAGPAMVMGIKVEIVGEGATPMREGTVIEAPAYIDGETQ